MILAFRGKELDPTDAGLRFSEFLMIEGIEGPDVETYGEFLKLFLEKKWPKD